MLVQSYSLISRIMGLGIHQRMQYFANKLPSASECWAHVKSWPRPSACCGTSDSTSLLQKTFTYAQFLLDDHQIIEQYSNLVSYCSFHVLKLSLIQFLLYQIRFLALSLFTNVQPTGKKLRKICLRSPRLEPGKGPL